MQAAAGAAARSMWRRGGGDVVVMPAQEMQVRQMVSTCDTGRGDAAHSEWQEWQGGV